jgi:hypothetical protein
MKNHSLGVVVAVLGSLTAGVLALSACASSPAGKPADTASKPAYVVADRNAQLPRFRIRNWSAPNDHTILVVADDGTRYRAETMGPCIGLNFATRLAFVNRGGFEQLDRYSSVLLSDGTRCTLQSFDKLKPPEAQALDSYEKSKDSQPEGEKRTEKEGSASPKQGWEPD